MTAALLLMPSLTLTALWYLPTRSRLALSLSRCGRSVPTQIRCRAGRGVMAHSQKPCSTSSRYTPWFGKRG